MDDWTTIAESRYRPSARRSCHDSVSAGRSSGSIPFRATIYVVYTSLFVACKKPAVQVLVGEPTVTTSPSKTAVSTTRHTAVLTLAVSATSSRVLRHVIWTSVHTSISWIRVTPLQAKSSGICDAVGTSRDSVSATKWEALRGTVRCAVAGNCRAIRHNNPVSHCNPQRQL